MGVSGLPLSLLLTLEPEAAVLAVASAGQRKAAARAASPGKALDAELELKHAEGATAGGSSSSSTARPAKPRLSAEDVVLVLDCGGGTVDLTMTRMYGTGAGVRLEEAAVGRGTGPLCGAVWSGLNSKLLLHPSFTSVSTF